MEGIKNRNKRVYDSTARGMAAKFNAIGARASEIAHVFELVGKENPLIIELGCGNGRDAKEFSARTTRYIGLDNSEEMIALARQQAPEARFEVADIDTYAFPESVDAVVSFASLLHSSEAQLESVLERAAEKMADGGIFVIDLKRGAYAREGTERTDEFGTRTFFCTSQNRCSDSPHNSTHSNCRKLNAQVKSGSH